MGNSSRDKRNRKSAGNEFASKNHITRNVKTINRYITLRKNYCKHRKRATLKGKQIKKKRYLRKQRRRLMFCLNKKRTNIGRN